MEAFAVGDNYTHQDKTNPDNLVATIRFANGAVASLIQGDAALPAYASKFFVELFGNGLSAQLYDRFHRATFSGPNMPNPGEMTAPAGEDPEGLAQELEDFLQGITQDKPWRIGATVQDGLRATALILACFDAIKTGKPQPVAR